MRSMCKKGHVRSIENLYKTGHCKLCERERQKNKYTNNKNSIVIKQRFKLYGVSEITYAEMLEQQHNRCAICGDSTKRLVIDHSHKTNKVRGLLCTKCNTSVLPTIENNPQLADSAKRYLAIYEI